MKQKISEVIEQCIRKRGITKAEAFRIMKVTRPTFLRLIKQPMQMNGIHRSNLARALGLSVEVVDVILNRRSMTTDEVEVLLNLIEPRKENE